MATIFYMVSSAATQTGLAFHDIASAIVAGIVGQGTQLTPPKSKEKKPQRGHVPQPAPKGSQHAGGAQIGHVPLQKKTTGEGAKKGRGEEGTLEAAAHRTKEALGKVVGVAAGGGGALSDLPTIVSSEQKGHAELAPEEKPAKSEGRGMPGQEPQQQQLPQQQQPQHRLQQEKTSEEQVVPGTYKERQPARASPLLEDTASRPTSMYSDERSPTSRHSMGKRLGRDKAAVVGPAAGGAHAGETKEMKCTLM